MEWEPLLDRARAVLNPRELTSRASCGEVAAALEAAGGEVFIGVCIDTACSMGFCAEHAAAAAMVTAGHSTVARMVAVGGDGSVLAPCGRCREFISQLDDRNVDAMVLVPPRHEVRLRDLLPHPWLA